MQNIKSNLLRTFLYIRNKIVESEYLKFDSKPEQKDKTTITARTYLMYVGLHEIISGYIFSLEGRAFLSIIFTSILRRVEFVNNNIIETTKTNYIYLISSFEDNEI